MRAMLMMLFCLAGCGGAADPAMLRGTWSAVDANGHERERYQFRDGGMYMHGDLHGEQHEWDAGSYTIAGDTLRFDGHAVLDGHVVAVERHYALLDGKLWVETESFEKCGKCDD